MGRMFNDITGIILSGGKSTRMGENKSFLKIGQQTIIEKLVSMMHSIFNEVIIITNEPELYGFLNLKLFEDIFKNVGPIAGIHSGLFNSQTEKNFIISCDIPLMNKEMIISILEYPSSSQITVPRADSYIQQLCGVYCKSLLPIIESIIRNDESQETRETQQSKRKCKVHNLLNQVQVTIIENIENLHGYNQNIFLNMNSKDDYEKILSKYY
jgi:molybdopterin-guanine dinucleotide biosynthesis protein A